MKRKLSLYYHTLKYLKWIQWIYRIRQVLWSKLGILNKDKPKTIVPTPISISVTNTKHNPKLYEPFEFLNLRHTMSMDQVDWNYDGFGKLWTYNLNYFDFIHQMDVETSLKWMRLYAEEKSLKDGLEPYPTALRLMNWIGFMLEHGIKDNEIQSMIYSDAYRLSKNIEYHLLGNHVLEDALAMSFAAIYFDHAKWKRQFFGLLFREWEEQFQEDGLHFEQSPMYHMILLDRFLDLALLAKDAGETELLAQSEPLLEKALTFAEFVHCYDRLPKMNDAADGIASTINKVRKKAKQLNLSPSQLLQGSESGYRKWTFEGWQILIDAGPVGPSYQPGHAHADTFSFELYSEESGGIILDTGTSTYQVNERRQLERSTFSHNTVAYFKQDSSEVWGGFRTARRAEVKWLEDSENCVNVQHNGYERFGVTHKRQFTRNSDQLIIKDSVSGGKELSYSCLHFHPSIKVELKDDYLLLNNEFKVVFEGFENAYLEAYDYAVEFNKLASAQKWVGEFRQNSKLTLVKISKS